LCAIAVIVTACALNYLRETALTEAERSLIPATEVPFPSPLRIRTNYHRNNHQCRTSDRPSLEL